MTWKAGQLNGYGYDTTVQILYDGDTNATWLDLAKEQYRWII